MAYDPQEQEQIESFKAWWKQYGNLLFALITLALLVFAGVNGWKWYQAKQARDAAPYYEALKKAVASKTLPQIKDTSSVLLDKYGRTAYAQMGALLATKGFVEAGDVKAAQAQLQWALDKAPDEEYRALARVRLAGLLLDQKDNEQALKIISVPASEAYAALFADRKGDVLAALGKSEEAKTAYKLALDKTQANSSYKQVIQLKLDALGG